MLKTPLLHPEILLALGGAGHGATVLIADGNFSCDTKAGPNATIVYLNLAPGVLSVTDVLDVLMSTIAVEKATVMQPDQGDDPPIFEQFRQQLTGIPLERVPRQAFYDAVGGPDTCLVIATGEQRTYANILLTLGVVQR